MISALKPAFTILFLSSASFTMGQVPDTHKEWAEGRLSWSDFSTRESLSGTGAEFKYFMGYTTVKETVRDTVVQKLKAIAYMDQSLSWVNPAYASELLLRYHQVMFDLLEIYKRRLQSALDLSRGVIFADLQFSEIYSQFQEQLDRFARRSDYGRNYQEVLAWELHVAKLVSQYPHYDLPQLKPRLFEYGMHAGFQYHVLTGRLGAAFRPAFALQYGFGLGYDKHVWKINVALGRNRSKKDVMANELFRDGEKISFGEFDILWGRIIRETPDYRLTPYLGICVFFMNSKDSLSAAELGTFSGMAGLQFDYKLRKKMKVNSIPKEMVTTIFFTRCFISYLPFKYGLNGMALNVGIGLGGIGHFLDIRPRTMAGGQQGLIEN